MATWAPTLPARDRYEVYARWRANSAHASDSPYVIFHEGGSTTVRVNQKTSNATWVLLGTFTMAPGEDHRVEMHDDVNGQVVADAVKFVPEAVAKTATWTVSVGTTGSYKIYAKWPASSQHATDVPYTVTHAGGTANVTVNQRVNGGVWNLLGTYDFDAEGDGYNVELSDQVAAGKVAADAIMFVPDETSTDAFVWTPTIPSVGTYEVYARSPASSNTGAAQYTVTHGGGTSEVTLNQKQNGSSWVPLGSWTFAPGAGHKVTLAAATEGTTIADAMLFVAAGAQPANLLYVHAGHLGSPQKLTDASQATVWDGVFDPFGEEIAITGLAAMPIRFPGQYADEETGFSYNYFRDYDPTLGRYVQSDPIGLRGGLHTYSYVINNPATYIDPAGLYWPGDHNSFSFTQARDGTCLKNEAVELGNLTGGVDSLPDSQLPRDAYWHSMSPPGVSPSVSAQMTKDYIDREMSKCTLEGLARALHAIQDAFAPGHRGGQTWNGMPWEPGGESWGSAILHFLGDFFPMSGGPAAATKAVIQEWCKRCKPCNLGAVDP